MTSPLERALEAYSAGIVPLRPRPGGKPPLGQWRQYQTEPPTRHDVETWFADWDGVGVLCGQASGGLEMLEWEGRAIDLDLFERFADTATQLGMTWWEQVHAGWSEWTPSGGIHVYYRVRGATVAGNTKLASDDDGVLIETRGEGGYSVIAPTSSTHADGGQGEWRELYGGPATLATITADQRDQLHALARSFDETPQLEPISTQPSTPAHVPESTHDGVSPGDDYAARTSWAELLDPHGWQLVFERNGIGYWRRPGKSDGWSATTNAMGTDRLRVWTTSTAFEPTSYSKLGALAVLEHGGNMQAAARKLAEDGYGTQRAATPAVDLSGLPSTPVPASGAHTGTETADSDAQPSGPFIVWRDFWERDHAGEDWLAYPLFPRGRAVALYAGAKTGKSLLVLDVVAALATGRPILGAPAVDPVDVIYLDYEMTEEDLAERLEEMGYGPDDNLDRLHYALLPTLPPLDTLAGGLAVMELVELTGARAVVIDTTSRATKGEENLADTYRELYAATGLQLKRAGVSMLRLDHAGKDKEKGQRGSSGKNDDVDVVYEVSKVDTGLKLRATHKRFSWAPAELQLNRADEPLRHTLRPANMPGWPEGTAEAARRLDRIGAPLDVTQRAAMRMLQDADLGMSTKVVAAGIKYRRLDADRRISLEAFERPESEIESQQEAQESAEESSTLLDDENGTRTDTGTDPARLRNHSRKHPNHEPPHTDAQASLSKERSGASATPVDERKDVADDDLEALL